MGAIPDVALDPNKARKWLPPAPIWQPRTCPSPVAHGPIAQSVRQAGVTLAGGQNPVRNILARTRGSPAVARLPATDEAPEKRCCSLRAVRGGANRTRSGDLLGAIQADTRFGGSLQPTGCLGVECLGCSCRAKQNSQDMLRVPIFCDTFAHRLDARALTVLRSTGDTGTPRSRGNIFRAGIVKTAGNLAVLPP